MPHLLATPDSSAATRIALWGGRELMMLVLASLFAGLATTPYAAFHFHRVTPYGVLANLAAMPVVSALVMPAGLLGLLAMPFGLDGVFWWLMGIGIDWMTAVTRWVAALPVAVGRMAVFGTSPMIAASVGIILMGLSRTPLRWSGAVMLGLSVIWALAARQPDVLISADGRSVAVRGPDGELHLMRSGKDVFLVKEWLVADADARVPGDATLARGVSCDDQGCVAALGDGALVTHATSAEALSDDCDRAVLVVSDRHAPQDCAAAVIDRDRRRRQGALALRRKADGFDVEAVKPCGFDRPWAPAAGDVAADAGTLSRPQAARGKDATPSENDLQPDD